VTWQQFEATRAARTWAQRTNDVIATIKDLDIAIRDAETGQRGYLLTGDND
jgi:CHASE3 domain sensor protein